VPGSGEDHATITIAVGRFDDLLARGIRSLIEDDVRLQLIAADVPREQIAGVLQTRSPRVAILDGDALASLAEVRELTLRHAGT
jgi:hypothetical protein